MRPSREISAETAETLEKMRAARDVMVKVRTNYPIKSPEYAAAGEAMKRIDDLVELMTGRREYLWMRSH